MEGAVALHRLRVLALVLAIGLLGAGGTAEAGQAPGPFVDIHSAAALAPDGKSMGIQLVASCPERWTVVEAVVTVSQPQASGRASFPLTCIGSLRPFGVTVPASVGTFELGQAQVNATIVIKRGRTDRTQDSQIVDVQPTVFVDLAETAQLQAGGAAVSIDVTTACPVGANGQQSRLGIWQGQTAGSGFYVPVCDGREHTATVTVQASQGLFQAGSAQAATFADVEYGGFDFSGFDESAVQIGFITPDDGGDDLFAHFRDQHLRLQEPQSGPAGELRGVVRRERQPRREHRKRLTVTGRLRPVQARR